MKPVPSAIDEHDEQLRAEDDAATDGVDDDDANDDDDDGLASLVDDVDDEALAFLALAAVAVEVAL
jgi:hypothetical protein